METNCTLYNSIAVATITKYRVVDEQSLKVIVKAAEKPLSSCVWDVSESKYPPTGMISIEPVKLKKSYSVHKSSANHQNDSKVHDLDTEKSDH